jgi:hypothetical protein
MATHRRPTATPTPIELLMFSADEWAAPDDEASWQAFDRWKDARRAYHKQHPHSALGSVLEQMRFERQVLFGSM